MTVQPGQPIPQTEPEIVQIDRNIHGFQDPQLPSNRSRNRSSSCPARTTDRTSSSSNPPSNPAPSPWTPTLPHPKHRNRAPRPAGGTPSQRPPDTFYIGENRDKDDEGEAREGERVEGETQHEDMRDYWAEAIEQNRNRMQAEQHRQAVNSQAAWSTYTGTTCSVQRASPEMEQRPFAPSHSHHATPAANSIPYNLFGQHASAPHNPQQCIPDPTQHRTFPAQHPNYTGTNWVQQGWGWVPGEQNCFANTFQQNAFVHQPNMHAFAEHPAQFQEQLHAQPAPSQMLHAPPSIHTQQMPMQTHEQLAPQQPIYVAGCTHCTQFQNRCLQLDRSQSTEFQPTGEYNPATTVPQLPIQSQLQGRFNPCAAYQGHQSSGVWVDRGSSDEFRPPEQKLLPQTNPHSQGPAFTHGMPATSSSELFSPLANPRPPMPGTFVPHVVSPPAVPSAGHFGLSQVSMQDFMPTMQEEWDARRAQAAGQTTNQIAGQSNSFFGHENPNAFSQQFDALHSASAPFNYAHVAAGTFGDRHETNMFGRGGWGEDIPEEETADMSVDHTAFRPPELTQNSFQSTFSSRPAHLPTVPESEIPYQPELRPTFLPQNQPMPPPPPPPFAGPGGFPGSSGNYPRTANQSACCCFGGIHQATQHQTFHGHAFPPTHCAGPTHPPYSRGLLPGGGPPGPPFPPPGGPCGAGPPQFSPPGGPFNPGIQPGGPPPPPPPYPGAAAAAPARPPPKRWLPPPSFTPGSSQGPSFKSWLWQLAAWCRLTGMSWEERALAVALSLGGRARSLVYTIPHNVLHRRDGLALLLQRLESDFGTELQDRAKSANQHFEQFRRSRQMSAAEYIASFEQAYQNAVDHGVHLSIPLLSMKLVERAGLTPTQEEWVLGAVGGDWNQYQGIRRALRRLPSLSGQNCGTFPSFPQQCQADPYAYPAAAAADQGYDDQYQPFSASDQLQIPPESTRDDDEYSCTQYSDDYCSTGSGDEEDCMHVQQAWAQLRRVRKRHVSKGAGKGAKKGGKMRFKRGRFRKRKTGTFVVVDDQVFPVNQRNLSQEIPQGWQADKWLARVPCPGCGSRYHRNCQNTPNNGASSSSGKGSGKRKGSGFATFMIAAATMLGSAQSFSFMPEPSYICPVISAHHFPAFVSEHHNEYQAFLATVDPTETFVGLEPYGEEYRAMRFSTFSSLTKSRYGLMLDTGAPESCCGESFLNRFLHDMEIHNAEWTEYSASLSGIGAGSASVNWKCKTPIGIANFCDAVWETQVLEGCGKNVPGLLGLQPMSRLNGVINLTDRTFIVDTPNGKSRKALQCYVITGHLILPIDWGGSTYKGTSQDFIKDPLGMSLWYTSEDGKPSANPMPTFKILPESKTANINEPLPCFPCFDKNNSQSSISEPVPCFPCFRKSDASVTLPPGLNPSPLPSEGEKICRPENFDDFAQPSAESNANAERSNQTMHMPMHPAFVGFVNRTHAFMSKLARRDKLLQNSTYRKKYAPLPKDSPIPDVTIPEGKWDFWEWWAGSARLTKAVIRKGLIAGPPITRELGWDLTLETHQRFLRLLFDKHAPEVLFAAPTCGPWSRSCTTMADETKQLIREEQVEAFNFFLEHVEKQSKANRKFLMENPRSSELLNEDSCFKLIEKYGANDSVTCMCSHGLTDPDSGKPNMKQTTLRGNLNLRKSVKWCSCKVEHQPLQGYTRSGILRTAAASHYTRLFSERLAQDIFDNVRRKHAFPADEYIPNPAFRPRDPNLDPNSDEEQVEDVQPAASDPYQEPTDEEVSREADKVEQQIKRSRMSRPQPPPPPAILEPKSKILPKPPKPTHVDEERRLSLPEQPSEPKAAGKAIQEVDGLATDPKTEPLPLATRRPVTDSPALNDLAKVGIQLANGGQRTFQTGPKVRLLQEMYGTPVGRTIRLVILTRKPGMIPIPEPLVSRALLSHFLMLTQDTPTSNWTNHGWREIGELISSPRTLVRKPQWSLLLFALESTEGDLAEHLQSTTLETLEQRAELDKMNSSSLPAVLKVLLEGSQQEQLRMLLTLHKRLYHKRPEELRAILNKSGVPGRILGMLNDAVSLCNECRRWQTTHASPAIKTRLSDHFNKLVYADLIFISDPALVMLVMVDDSIRWTVIENVFFKDFHTLTEHFRKAWLKQYGPMETLRTDCESALASDQFGILLESLGIKRELVLAKDSHTLLGPIDRKIKIIRLAAPRIIDTLLQDSIKLSGDDLASELQFCVNTQLTYGGVSPYNCLFGTQPREFWSDETDTTSSYDVKLPFYEMIHVRHKSIGAFHQALLRFRLEKGVRSRPRSDQAANYQVGQLVDIFIKSTRKDQESWRGPATILGFLGEGRCTVRWQSIVRDVPYNLIRPYISVINASMPLTAIKDAELTSPEEPAPAADAPQELVARRPMKVPPPVTSTPPGRTEGGSSSSKGTYPAFTVGRNEYETYFNTSSADQLRGPYLDTLMSLTSAMQIGQQILHAFEINSSAHTWSRDAIRDGYVIFNVAKKFAAANSIPHFAGAIMQAGRRYVAPWDGGRFFHCIAWTDSQFARVITAPCNQQIDWISQGICTLDELHLLRAVIIIEARKEVPTLSTLLQASQEAPETTEPAEGRVREPWYDDELIQPPSDKDEEDDSTDAGPSISERDANEVFIAKVQTDNLLRRDLESASLNREKHYYPLDKDSRPLTEEEIQSMGPEVKASKLKELTSWVKNKAGKPKLRSEYTKRTGLKPLPTRWVGTFKRKKGVKIVKHRLVGKGYAEANQSTMETSSPTATRTGHRIVCSVSARKHWELHSLDVSAAFLKGFDFETLKDLGHHRQPVALNVSAEIFELLAEIDPETWSIAVAHPDQYCIELTCGAYGLKDAPLLWYIRLLNALTSHGLRQSNHDPCVFYSPLPQLEIEAKASEIAKTGVAVDLIMSLHVDDTLATGTTEKLEWLEKMLVEEFQDITTERNHFKHFGVDVYRHPTLFHISACQRDYIAELKPIDIPPRCRKDDACDTQTITAFRSLVSGVAWSGVTYAPSLAAASLFQGFLPSPTWEHCKMLNEALKQIQSEYTPLMYRSDLQGPFRLVVVSDSSLGNSSKYSQGGFFVLLATQTDNLICGACHTLAFKSGKSKRVASSTEHAEVLALLSGVEEALFLQTWMYEVANPYISSLQLLHVSGQEHMQIVSVTDCLDVLESLTKTAVPTPVNRALTLYLHALRELFQLKFVEAYAWCDTRDNIANSLTKIKPDGTLDLGDLKEFYQCGGWEPKQPFRWHSSRLSDPSPFPLVPLPKPPPSTKQMADYKLRETDLKEIANMLPSLQYRFAYATFEIELPL